MKCVPDFNHILQNSLNPLPLWTGPQAGAAALETVWRLLRKLQIEPPWDQRCTALAHPKYRCMGLGDPETSFKTKLKPTSGSKSLLRSVGYTWKQAQACK